MKKILYPFAFLFIVLFTLSCKNETSMKKNIGTINNDIIISTVRLIQKEHPQCNIDNIAGRVKQVANFWNQHDGTPEDFTKFCITNYLDNDKDRIIALDKISRNFEILYGYFNRINVGLKEPLNMELGPITPIDDMFGGYDPSSHTKEDLFNNKIAFYILLNFKFYSLAEKTKLAASWNRQQWALARLAEFSDSRIPAELALKYSEIYTKSDSYISDYNIYMGNLVNDKNQTLFPKDMKLISHWGLRDELKSNYNKDGGLDKQKMIFSVMNRIINQEIPQEVINSNKYSWNPETNKLFEGNKEITGTPEPDTRYDFLLENFKALYAMDAYNPFFPTYIKNKFEREMEIPQEDVEKLFIELVSSPEVKKVAALIEKRLDRKIEPFDIWYDGFKARSTINTEELDPKIQKKYPTSANFEKDIPNILIKLGFAKDKAEYIASKIQVDAARGSGHAWGALMKGDKARLRTRIGPKGMDYKGFNIAMHELGHCVEQTLTLYDMDYYLLNGVPNTAFTEALAFIFQKRDLEVLGIKNENPLKNDMMALDIFWSNYEIMGVSLVDMNVWKWLYENPNATKTELKNAVISIAKDIWNKYYAGVFGAKDQSILAVYSHMIDNPLYLSAYPIGHLIDFQIEKQLEGKSFGDEVMRIYSKGRIIPQEWMKEAVGKEISNKPLLEAVNKALGKI